jgi:hypothetical protein
MNAGVLGEAAVRRGRGALAWWLRVVGAFYGLQFVANALLQAPIRTVGPVGVLERASAGDSTARFLVDTWITFGLEIGAIGVALLIASLRPEQTRALVWAVLGIEVARGIVNDVYMLARGYDATVFVTWIIIHSVVIVTGLSVLRSARSEPIALERR